MFSYLLTYLNPGELNIYSAGLIVIIAVVFYYIFKGVKFILKIVFYLSLAAFVIYYFKDYIINFF
jgi:hypothetical protein